MVCLRVLLNGCASVGLKPASGSLKSGISIPMSLSSSTTSISTSISSGMVPALVLGVAVLVSDINPFPARGWEILIGEDARDVSLPDSAGVTVAKTPTFAMCVSSPVQILAGATTLAVPGANFVFESMSMAAKTFLRDCGAFLAVVLFVAVVVLLSPLAAPLPTSLIAVVLFLSLFVFFLPFSLLLSAASTARLTNLPLTLMRRSAKFFLQL
mmetsp:Transcript_21522/g.32712  ORF Transcript_21522/g.32712 Transcript_21522/m.32712 type:complete len:212 (+) Transcript_21522:355-990(+)